MHWTQCVAQIEIIPVWPLTRSNNRIHQWMLWQTWFQLILRIRLKSMTKRMVTTSGSIVYGVHTVKRIHPKGRQIGHLCTNNTHTQKEKREQKWENEIIVLAQIAFMFKSLREKKCEYWVTVILVGGNNIKRTTSSSSIGLQNWNLFMLSFLCAFRSNVKIKLQFQR